MILSRLLSNFLCASIKIMCLCGSTREAGSQSGLLLVEGAFASATIPSGQFKVIWGSSQLIGRKRATSDGRIFHVTLT